MPLTCSVVLPLLGPKSEMRTNAKSFEYEAICGQIHSITASLPQTAACGKGRFIPRSLKGCAKLVFIMFFVQGKSHSKNRMTSSMKSN